MTLPNPYSVTARKKLSAKQKLKMFLDAGGICCVCGHKIDGVREAWDEHVDPLSRTGTNAPSNRKPAHERCARIKTAKEATERAKIQRVAEHHLGAKKSRRPMPGSKLSRWKKKMNGEVVERE